MLYQREQGDDAARLLMHETIREYGLEALATSQNCAQEQGIQPPSGSEATSALVRKLMGMGTSLGKLVNGRIYRGVVTGRNEAFVVDQATHDRLIAEDPRSAEVLKPFLRGRDVGRYAIHSANLWLIRIENGWTAASMEMRKPQEQDAWRHFQRTYPAIARHLQRFEEPCRKRDDQGQFWWELRPCDYYDAFEQPKIVYPDIGYRGEYAWDTSHSYIGNTNYCIVTAHKWLCALLNTRVLDFVFATLSPQIRGGYFRYIYQYTERLPIIEPATSDKRWLEELVVRLQELRGAGPEAEMLEREVDLIVYRMYGLSQKEIAEIERWHAQRRELLGGKRGKARANEQPEPEE